MVKVKILSEKPIMMAEVKEELAKIEKKEGQLNFRANKTYAHMQEFAKLSGSKAKELYGKIDDLKIPRLKDEHIVKIVDTMPKYTEEVKALLSGYTITLANDKAKKIAETVAQFS